jgi:hypothetical protein
MSVRIGIRWGGRTNKFRVRIATAGPLSFTLTDGQSSKNTEYAPIAAGLPTILRQRKVHIAQQSDDAVGRYAQKMGNRNSDLALSLFG